MKKLIAIVAVVALLLALLLLFPPGGHDTADIKPPADATAASVEPATHAALPRESGEDVASNLLTSEPASSGEVSDQEDRARNETQAIDGTAIPIADTAADSAAEAKPDPRPGTGTAECWGLRGSAPRDFTVTQDREVRTSGDASALIASRRDTAGYVTMFQTSAAGPVRGKRVEFSADVRTRDAKGGANLLLRAEDANGNTVAFDNMVTGYIGDQRPYQIGNRGVTGDSEWSTQHVVVDIPDEARVITYGVSMFGSGKAWIDNARIEVVANETDTTAPDIRQSPTAFYGIPINPASLTRSPRNLGFDLEARAGAAPCN